MAAHREWAARPPALARAQGLLTARHLRSSRRSQGSVTRPPVSAHRSSLRSITQGIKVQIYYGSISDTTAMNELLRGSVADLRNRRDKHAAVISEQFQALEPLEGKCSQDTTLEEAVSWFEKFLGFQVIGQEGIEEDHSLDQQCRPPKRRKEDRNALGNVGGRIGTSGPDRPKLIPAVEAMRPGEVPLPTPWIFGLGLVQELHVTSTRRRRRMVLIQELCPGLPCALVIGDADALTHTCARPVRRPPLLGVHRSPQRTIWPTGGINKWLHFIPISFHKL